MEEREIDLIDLMVEILYRWKGMVLAALVGAVLLGGFSYYKSMQAAQSASYTSMPAKEAKEYLERGLSATDKFNARQAVASERALERYEEYFEESVLMNLDPNAVPQAVLVYSVDAKDQTEAENITALYIQMLKSGKLAEHLSELDGSMTKAAASELISVSGSYDTGSTMVFQDTFASAYGTAHTATTSDSDPAVSFTVILRNRTEEAVVPMADAADEYIGRLSKDNAFSGKSHTCKLAARSEGVVMDAELMEKQKVLTDAVYAYSNITNYAATSRDKLKGSGLAYYNVLKELEKEFAAPDPRKTADDATGSSAEATGSSAETAGNTAGTASVSTAKPSINKKYIIIGFVAGAFVYAGVLLLIYLLDSRIHYTDDLNVLYGLSRIGSIPDEKKWNRSAYTRWLRKIRDRGNRFFARDKAVELSCTGIRTLAGKKELSSVCVIGCSMEGQTGEVASSIVNSVSGSGLKAEAIADILYDADAYNKFCSYQGVVLLEKAGETMYEEIMNELRKITDQGLTLLGAVVVE